MIEINRVLKLDENLMEEHGMKCLTREFYYK